MLTIHSFFQSFFQRRGSGGHFSRICAQFFLGVVFVMAITLVSGLAIDGGSHSLTAFAETPGSLAEARETALGGRDVRSGLGTVDGMVQRMGSDRYTEDSRRGMSAMMIRRTEDIQAGYAVTGSLVVQEEKARQTARVLADRHIQEAQEEMRLEEEARQRAEEARRLEEEKRVRQARMKTASAVPVSVSYTQEDYQVLLKIVEAEAGVCDEKGKILVANVILNRVRNKEFPNSITGVVYEPDQFSPVRDGSLGGGKVSGQTVECVDRALAGEDYSQGALYFMNRAGSRSGAVTWFDTHLTYLFRHDSHEFFK